MLRFSQFNDVTDILSPNSKDHQMNEWFNGSTNQFCQDMNEIDEIIQHEDVLLLDSSLSATPGDIDIDSITDLLDTPSSSSPTSNSTFTQPLNIIDLPSTSTTFTINNTSQSNTAASHSSLGISPKFTTLSLNHSNPCQTFVPSNNLHLTPYIQQNDSSILGTSYPSELKIRTNGPSDIKRFRSASMNEGPLLPQYQKLDPLLFDSLYWKSPPYVNSPTYQNKTPSSNAVWPIADGPRPLSNSFSEGENHQQQQQQQHQQQTRVNLNSLSKVNYRNPKRHATDMNFERQTLYSINQTNDDELTRKRSSIVDFPLTEVEIKDDPSSPNGTIEQHSELDQWSDIEHNSPDTTQENEGTSDDDTTISTSLTKTQTNNPSSSLFWQYNVQSKGPKTKRILYLKERDPRLHREFSDPVYQIKLTQTKGQVLNKLRKGDGNDVTPNPAKLYQLGKQISELSSNPTSLYHGIYNTDQPINTNNTNNDTVEVKKEKNKIASRACRLRKKAQHEANKLKLHGLNEEHKSLIDIITSIKLYILKKYENGDLTSSNQSLDAALDNIISHKYGQQVAGNSDGYVQAILNGMEESYALKQQRSYSLNT